MNNGVTADFDGLTRAGRNYDALSARARQIHDELTQAGVFHVKFGPDDAGRKAQRDYDRSISEAMQSLWDIHLGLGTVRDGIGDTKNNLARSDQENADVMG